ncbi:MAG: TetR/AcrR family transcriptional regulator [Mycobacteriales bacterium]
MEKKPRGRLLDEALELLGRSGSASLTVRAVEDAAGVPHGSVRHHFGDRAGMVAALFEHLADREVRPVEGGSTAAALEHLLGPGRTLTLARYELFLMAARDPSLRPALVRQRERFVAKAAERVGPGAAPALIAALDGVVLDALVRGNHDPARLRSAVQQVGGD